MARPLTPERLATATLRRQFPRVPGRKQAALVELVRRLGPVQTQVPRAAFVFAASRLPGVGHDEVVAAFESQRLVKASNLRGTVHTSTRAQHPLLAAVSRRPRALLLRAHLRLERATPDQVAAEVERLADDWIERDDLVAGLGTWLSAREGRDATPATTAAANLVWGHPSLIRRPPDRRWHTRTDTLHRHLPATSGEGGSDGVVGADGNAGDRSHRGPDVDQAHDELVRLHLGTYGPATRRDVAFWLGARLTDVDAALARLDGEVVRLHGADGAVYLDLAEPPRGGADPGTVLLPEFDGLLLGYEGSARDRFLDREHLPRIWRRANGLFSPGVLHEGRIAGTWRWVVGSAPRLEVTPFPGTARLDEVALAPSAGAVATALGLELHDIRVLPA